MSAHEHDRFIQEMHIRQRAWVESRIAAWEESLWGDPIPFVKTDHDCEC